MSVHVNAFPTASITNGLIQATLYLPHIEKGFYRSTRFDWSGVISRLRYNGHEFYGPWYTNSDPPVWDFVYRGSDIITGAQSTITGPAEEFLPPLGYEQAKPGGTFVKVGVGMLRKIDDAVYSPFANYDIIEHGTWTSRAQADAVEFSQEFSDPASGYGYRYHKSVRLTAGIPELVIAHRLSNIGRRPIETSHYNHNFLVLDGAAPGPDFLISVPFQIKTTDPPDPALATIQGNEISYVKTLEKQDKVYIPIEGFSQQPQDYDIRIENRRIGAGMRVTADRPLAKMMLWSIRSTLCMEPFIDVSTAPGATTTWTLTYTYNAKNA